MNDNEIMQISNRITESYLYIKTFHKDSTEFRKSVDKHKLIEHELREASKRYWMAQGIDINPITSESMQGPEFRPAAHTRPVERSTPAQAQRVQAHMVNRSTPVPDRSEPFTPPTPAPATVNRAPAPPNEQARFYREQYQNRYDKYDAKYSEMGDKNDACIYCNHRASEWDHIPPMNLLERSVDQYPNPYKVRSCQKCNDTLGNHPSLDIGERRRYLIRCYEKIDEDVGDRLEFMRNQ